MRLWRRDMAETNEASLAAGARGSVILGATRFVRMHDAADRHSGRRRLARHPAGRDAGRDVRLVTFLLARALAPVENAIATWKSLVASRFSYHRLVDLLADMSWAQKGMDLPAPEGALLVDRVSFVPPGGEEPTLRGVSFALLPGEVLGIVGPSAAGKSTLARLIAGTWRPTAGKVRLDNAEIAVWHASGGSRHIGYLPQDIELFSGTVRENIARLADAAPDQVIDAAKLAGLHETQSWACPSGYDSEIGDAGVQASRAGSATRQPWPRRRLRHAAPRHPRRAQCQPRPGRRRGAARGDHRTEAARLDRGRSSLTGRASSASPTSSWCCAKAWSMSTATAPT